MNLTTQYAFSGDYTGELRSVLLKALLIHNLVEAIEKSVFEVSKYDAGKLITRTKGVLHP